MRRDTGTVLDIFLACRDIEEFLTGYDRELFLDDRRTRYAVIHQIIVIGEAVKRLSDEFRDEQFDAVVADYDASWRAGPG